MPASPSCPFSPATCVGLHAWVATSLECERLCQENSECVRYSLVKGGGNRGTTVEQGFLLDNTEMTYYKTSPSVSDEEGSGDNSLMFTDKQITFPASQGNYIEDKLI